MQQNGGSATREQKFEFVIRRIREACGPWTMADAGMIRDARRVDVLAGRNGLRLPDPGAFLER
jgi:hypothetical protein